MSRRRSVAMAGFFMFCLGLGGLIGIGARATIERFDNIEHRIHELEQDVEGTSTHPAPYHQETPQP